MFVRSEKLHFFFHSPFMGYFPPPLPLSPSLSSPIFVSSSPPPPLNPSFPLLSSSSSFHIALILILVSSPRSRLLFFSSLFLPFLFVPIISRDHHSIENKEGENGGGSRERGLGGEGGGTGRSRDRGRGKVPWGREQVAGGSSELTAGRDVPVSVTAN